MRNSALYEQDFHAWANEQAELLREGKLSLADIEHIAEEIESMGKTEKRELLSRLTVLLTHLLKWQHQSSHRGKSWEATIAIQRRALTRHLKDNPSLRHRLNEAIADAYTDARDAAYAETELPKVTFPNKCPWSLDQMMAEDFWPEN